MKRIIAVVTVGIAAILVIGGYGFLVFFEDISTEPPRLSAPHPEKALPSKPLVHVGVISRYTPTTIYQGYQPMMDYLTEVTPYRFELKLGRTYWETVELLANGKVTVAFLGRKVYLRGRERYGLTAILKPRNAELQPYSQDAVIARSDSGIGSLQDLVGRSLALPSQDSYSGNWLRAEGFAINGQAKFPVKKLQHFEHHHTVVYQVLRGNFDAGVVRESVAKEYAGKGIVIVAWGQPVPGSPIVTTKRHDARVVSAFIGALLAVDPRKPEFAQRLSAWDAEFRHGFAPANDQEYDRLQAALKGSRTDP
jgi:phosphonate transport system substrate-binding protein